MLREFLKIWTAWDRKSFKKGVESYEKLMSPLKWKKKFMCVELILNFSVFSGFDPLQGTHVEKKKL